MLCTLLIIPLDNTFLYEHLLGMTLQRARRGRKTRRNKDIAAPENALDHNDMES